MARRLSATLVAAVTAAALAVVAPTAAYAADPGRTPGRTDGTSQRITLITGDRVTITGDGKLGIERAPGRSRIQFISRTDGDHQYVIPADALPLLRAKRLDQRLFDVRALRDFGYTADHALPLLVAYQKNGSKAARAATGTSAEVTRDLTGVGALAVRAQRTARGGLWKSLTSGTGTTRALKPGIERIYLDGKRKINLDVSVPQIGAPAAWQKGLDGTGVTVAVLDTGIDATHPDFTGKLSAVQNFTAAPSADDTVGHGTHVASIIAGSGARSGGKYKGVAPGAELAIGKVCETDFCDDSAILAGMQWAAPIAPVVNLSLGGYDFPGIDPLEQAVEDLTAAHNTLFVIAAGNDGGKYTVGSPGSADSALTVGAVDDEDQLADFSSRGPRVGDDAIKPDITAPGVDIVAAGARNGEIGDPAADGYVSLSGTSMATPHVAGAAAIVAQQHPAWSSRQRKTLLMGAAKPTAGLNPFEQGAGRVDVARTVAQAVSVDEGSVSFGRQQWPHDDDVPITKTVTYRNGGTAPVTLALSLTGDTGTYSAAASTLTVPAGGTATTTVTADTRGGGADGFRTGALVATAAGDVKVETPLAVNREVESYDVTFRHIGRDGGPGADHVTSLLRTDADPEIYDLPGQAADETVRLPKGTYGMFSWIYGEADLAMLVQTELVVAGAQTVRLDARRAKPVAVSVPAADASQVLVAANADWTGEQYGLSVSALSGAPGDTYTAQIGPKDKVANFYGSISASFARWDAANETFRNSPYSYDLGYLKRGTFYTGFVKDVRAAELATVKADYAKDPTGADGVKVQWPDLGAPIGGWAAGIPFALPAKRTEYLSTEGATRWSGEFQQELPPADEQSWPEMLSIVSSPEKRFEAGTETRQSWNTAVIAPATAGNVNVAVRYEDTIVAAVPLFSDGAGHLGFARYDTARTALYAGSTLIGEDPSDIGIFDVPPAAAGYRLEMSATRGAPFRLSTSVSGVWTFRSATAEEARLPLSTVRFAPRVNEQNSAPAGATVDIPVSVERPTNSGAGANQQLAVEYSTDDGRTWKPAELSADRRTARVVNPAGYGFVSLRANATDTAGNTAAVTVIRAYAVG